LMMLMVLHMIPDADDPHGIVKQFLEALPLFGLAKERSLYRGSRRPRTSVRPSRRRRRVPR
jgi:hypothetical protein